MATDEEAKEIKRLAKENDIEVRDKVSNTRAGHSKTEQDSELEAALAATE
jgi:type III secretory pathway component EscU